MSWNVIRWALILAVLWPAALLVASGVFGPT